MPRALNERAAAFARGETTGGVPEARHASTVVLLRTHDDGSLSTFLMRRVSSMAFAAGMHVFPGGSVDEADFADDIPWRQVAMADASTSPLDDPGRMNADGRLARALVVCAVRELFEETGVLVAVDHEGRTPERDADWDRDRRAVEASAAALAGVLHRRGLAIDPRLLPLWAHWVTPEIEPKRFDVRFFVAFLPEGQLPDDASGEADHVRWITPVEAMASYAAGQLTMLPPTAATIADFVPLSDGTEPVRDGVVDGVMRAARGRVVQPLLPRPRLRDDGELAWDLVDARDGSIVVAGRMMPPSKAMGTQGD